MIVRTANYRIEQGVLHRDGVLMNINYLALLDADLSVRSAVPLVDRSTEPPRHESRIRGYEDCRLFAIGERWFATATVCDLNPDERREVALLELDGADIVSVTPLAGPDPARHEKNWMPFADAGELRVVYSATPTLVLRHDLTSGAMTTVARHPGPPGGDQLRGGSQGVAVDGGTLFVVHEVDRTAARPRYLHRFLLLDTALAVAGLSPPFTFTSDRVEFCAGMARHGDELVLSFGISDAAAGLAVVDLGEALALAQPARSDLETV